MLVLFVILLLCLNRIIMMIIVISPSVYLL